MEAIPLKNLVRLYRAEGAPNQSLAAIPEWVKESESYKNNLHARGRWFTNDLQEALWYLKNEYPGGVLKYIDVPEDVLDQFRVSNARKSADKSIKDNPTAFSRRPDKEFYLSRQLADLAKILEHQ